MSEPVQNQSAAAPHHRIRKFQWSMRILGVLYAASAVVFFFFPAELIYLINVGPKVFKVTEAMADPTDHFWTVLASSGMAALAALSFFSAESPRVRGYLLVQLLVKTVTITGFIYMFLNERRYFGYVLGAGADVLVTGFIFWKLLGMKRASS